jgi:hypothetical protein
MASVRAELAPLFSVIFFKLSGYANEAIRKSLNLGSEKIDPEVPAGDSDDPGGLVELDVMLPKVCEALVLVTQCIVSITLPGQGKAEANIEGGGGYSGDGKGKEGGLVEDGAEKSGWVDEEDDEEVSRDDLRRVMNEAKGIQGIGLVEILIGELVY